MSKAYPPKQLSDHGQKASRACMWAAKSLVKLAKAHRQPYRNIGTYSGEPLVVAAVEAALRDGFTVKGAAWAAVRAYASFKWRLVVQDFDQPELTDAEGELKDEQTTDP